MLLLDSEALSAIAHGPTTRRNRVRALIQKMRDRERPVGTVTAILVEVIRGRPADAAVFSAVSRHRLELISVDRPVAVRAGHLLGAAGAGSELAVDAFLVSGADLGGGAVIATTDPDDLNRLAGHAMRVTIADIT